MHTMLWNLVKQWSNGSGRARIQVLLYVLKADGVYRTMWQNVV